MNFFTCHVSIDFLRLLVEEQQEDGAATIDGVARVTGAKMTETMLRQLVRRELVAVVERDGDHVITLTEGGQALVRDLAKRGWPATGDSRWPLAHLYKKIRIRI